MPTDISKIQSFVGNVTPEQIRNVDSFISENIAIFLPISGPCYYSLSENHTHPAYSFYYLQSDSMQVSVENRIIDSKQGYIGCFSPNLQHHEIMNDSFNRFVAILIKKDFFEKEALFYNISTVFKGVSVKPSEDIYHHIRDFMAEASVKTAGSERVLASLELRLTHMILRSIGDIRICNEIFSQRLDIDRCIEYIYSHFSEIITVENLAQQCALTPSHFSRIFKKETGLSPQDFLINTRLNKAKMMLMRGDLKITEIALNCGFSSSSHFTSSFTKKYQIQPSKYKNLNTSF